MARMIYDIKVIDDNPEKAKINRLCFDGSISEMVSMLLYPISKMMEQSVKEWGTTGADAFKALLLRGVEIVYKDGIDGYIESQDQGGT